MSPEEAVERYGKMVWDEANKAARRLLWFVPMDADDLAGYGFIGLLKGIQKLDETRSEAEQFVWMRWKVIAAINHAIHMNNPSRHRGASGLRVDDPEGLILDSVPAPRQDLDTPIDADLLRKRLWRLTPIREYAIRREMEGASKSQIARELGRERQAVSHSLGIARDQVRSFCGP